MRPVPRIGRVLDLLGLVLFGGGALLFARAWIGFLGVRDYVAPPDAPPFANLALADEFWRLQKIATGVMVVGVAIFVLAWWTARCATNSGGDAPPS